MTEKVGKKHHNQNGWDFQRRLELASLTTTATENNLIGALSERLTPDLSVASTVIIQFPLKSF